MICADGGSGIDVEVLDDAKNVIGNSKSLQNCKETFMINGFLMQT